VDSEACVAAIEAQSCEAPTVSYVHLSSTVEGALTIDDPQSLVSVLGIFNAAQTADKVGYIDLMNSECIVACVYPCPIQASVCAVEPGGENAGMCLYCDSPDADTTEECASIINACQSGEPTTTMADPESSSSDGSADTTGG